MGNSHCCCCSSKKKPQANSNLNSGQPKEAPIKVTSKIPELNIQPASNTQNQSMIEKIKKEIDEKNTKIIEYEHKIDMLSAELVRAKKLNEEHEKRKEGKKLSYLNVDDLSIGIEKKLNDDDLSIRIKKKQLNDDDLSIRIKEKNLNHDDLSIRIKEKVLNEDELPIRIKEKVLNDDDLSRRIMELEKDNFEISKKLVDFGSRNKMMEDQNIRGLELIVRMAAEIEALRERYVEKVVISYSPNLKK